MGWFTRDPKAAADSTAPIERAAAQAAAQAAAPTKTRDDLANEELSALLSSFKEDTTTTSSSTPTKKEPEKATWTDTLYPQTMSCREAFDELLHCYSLGGQFKNWYRYGEYRDCQDKSDDFWFCMRTTMYGPIEKREMVVRYHMEKEGRRYKGGKSSEDVWETRTSGIGGVFGVERPAGEGEETKWEGERRA